MPVAHREPHPSPDAAPVQRLTLFDTTSIIVGIIIGSGLYETTPLIASFVPSAGWLMTLWIVGGCFALIGSLCYAELATTYPEEGGDYVYLTRAFGLPVGFLYAWCQLWIIRPGSIGAMAYVFARYAAQLAPLGQYSLPLYAAMVVGGVSALNLIGVREVKWTQNALTAAKVLGLVVLAAIGFTSEAEAAPVTAVSQKADLASVALALLLVVYTYGGWNDMAFVAAEVRNPRRNIHRALFLGTLSVVVIYLSMNFAFMHAVGFVGLRNSQAIAADVAELGLGAWGRKAISVLICISTLGAINGMVFTGARIYYALGKDHSLFKWLGRWNERFGTPVRSLLIQAATTLAAVAAFAAMDADGMGQNSFQHLVYFTTPVFWSFLVGTGAALIVLRLRDAQRERPYRVPLFPVIPIVFCIGSLVIVFASLKWAISQRSIEAALLAVVMISGLIIAAFTHGSRPQNREL